MKKAAKKRKTVLNTLIILILANFIFVSQGLVLCFEPGNKCILEYKISPCSIEKNSTKSQNKKAPSLQKQTCSDVEISVDITNKKCCKPIIASTATPQNLIAYNFKKHLFEKKNIKLLYRQNTTKILSTIVLRI
ncbi:hypothetical protein TTHT_0093 [Thermotomaculum hydrothermale]|uniref:Uncharacterized protein n=1 Tax=Thermotomaculum hydrothermale TaxID=981385 RepID=A0A7R6SYC7_9BACT|nr:hypothetical protein [Thermotomaculum hydrothermale]BBB31740.1 hypothetical protein TTHT_0093 [Thermotomaculum hydrothermale]